MNRGGNNRPGWLSAFALTCLSAGAATLAFSAPDAGGAWRQTAEGYALFCRGDLPAAAQHLQAAVKLAPQWTGPRGVLGALYQQQWFQRRCPDSGPDGRLRELALAEYAAVQRAALQPLMAGPRNPPWLAGPAVVAPARGVLGGSPDNLLHSLQAVAAAHGNPLPSPRALLTLTTRPLFPWRDPTKFPRGNSLPAGSVRPNDPHTAKRLKNLPELLAQAGAVATWELNQRRLESDCPPLVPDAFLVCLARAFAYWAVATNTRRHKWRQERFQRAYPRLYSRYNLKEVLAWADSRYGSFVLNLPSVRDLMYRLFKSPGHYEALLDPRMKFAGPACLADHAGSYVLQIELVGPPPTTRKRSRRGPLAATVPPR